MTQDQPDIIKRLKREGYATFDSGKDYDLNIVGIRSPNRSANLFDDKIIVAYQVDQIWRAEHFKATTDPGTYWLTKEGYRATAILKAGQYRGAYKIGLHRGTYPALVQIKPVQVYRDGDKDNVLDLDAPVETGLFGINIHRAAANEGSTRVNKWSAGCQVLQAGFDRFMWLCRKQLEHNPTYKTFTYTLLED